MAQYASDTKVSAERSRMEIETILRRYGASAFGYFSNRDGAQIAFEVHDRRVVFSLPLPDPNAEEFTHSRRSNSVYLTKRSAESAHAHWEQACRQRWRALALAIKAKLEAVECGITTFEQEFLAHIQLPNGQTVGDAISPAIANAYRTGVMPRMGLLLTAGDPEVQP